MFVLDNWGPLDLLENQSKELKAKADELLSEAISSRGNADGCEKHAAEILATVEQFDAAIALQKAARTIGYGAPGDTQPKTVSQVAMDARENACDPPPKAELHLLAMPTGEWVVSYHGLNAPMTSRMKDSSALLGVLPKLVAMAVDAVNYRTCAEGSSDV